VKVDRRELYPALAFVLITIALTLLSAIVLVPLVEPSDLDDGFLLRASVLYVAVVGWQPLVARAIVRRVFADRRSFDDGIRPIAARESALSVMLAVFVLAVAVAIEGIHGEPTAVADAWPSVARFALGFAAIVAILYLQAIVEELAWRAYVLPRLMRSLGPWPGLLVHGLVWGLTYAPLFRSLGYIVTCCLLGAVLGWLRLATRSIYASAASNATLTIGAGLPLLLVGESSRMSAAFAPSGWLPLAAVVAMIAWYRPWRTAIAIPWRHVPEHIN
jgi:membrane protease YdiL (CAAX protease family)